MIAVRTTTRSRIGAALFVLSLGLTIPRVKRQPGIGMSANRTKRVGVDFYQVNLPANCTQDFQTILAQTAAAQGEQRVEKIDDVPFRLQELRRENTSLIEGDLCRIRMDQLPVKTSLDGAQHPVECEDDEGIGESTAFLYYRPRRVLVLQRNRFGVSSAKFARYFERRIQSDDQIELLPIMSQDAMTRLLSMKRVTCFRLKFAGVRDTALKRSNSSLNQLFDLSEQLAAPVVSVDFSVGRQRKRSLDLEPIKKLCKDVVRFIQRSTIDADRIEVVGSDGAGEREVLDLLKDRIQETVEVHVSEDRTLTFDNRINGLHEAWNRAKSEILELLRDDEGAS